MEFFAFVKDIIVSLQPKLTLFLVCCCYLSSHLCLVELCTYVTAFKCFQFVYFIAECFSMWREIEIRLLYYFYFLLLLLLFFFCLLISHCVFIVEIEYRRLLRKSGNKSSGLLNDTHTDKYKYKYRVQVSVNKFYFRILFNSINTVVNLRK